MIPPRRRKSFFLPLEFASIGLKGRYSFPSPMKFLGTSSGGKDGPYVIGAMFSAAYSEKAKRLAASCERFALPYVIHEVPTVHRSISLRGSDDLAYTKPNFIRHLLATHGKPVLYLDADCEFVSEPDLIKDLIGSRCDFSIHNGCAEEYTDMYVPLPLRLQSDGPVIRNRFYRYGGSFQPVLEDSVDLLGSRSIMGEYDSRTCFAQTLASSHRCLSWCRRRCMPQLCL